MKIHEYQAKDIFSKYGIPVPEGRVARNPDEAAQIAAELGGRAVVKAQVHAGGRGKAGGIKVVNSPEEAAAAADSLIGTNLVTFQTGPEGSPIRSVLVEEIVDVETELYVGMAIDGAAEGIVAIASAAGGMENRRGRRNRPRKDNPSGGRSRARTSAVPRPQTRLRTRRSGRPQPTSNGAHGVPPQTLRRERLLSRRNQSARHNHRRPRARYGRQNKH